MIWGFFRFSFDFFSCFFRILVMETLQNLTAVFEKSPEGGFIAYLLEIDGINGQGETKAEAKENLLQAFSFYLEIRKEEIKKMKSKQTILEPLFA